VLPEQNDSPTNPEDGPAAPLVSIIIPCYNGSAFIAQAIESALTQTYLRIEVVVVDDGSTDDSAKIISRYPVSYIRTDREGVSGARNRGVQESHGEFLVFLDADDLLLPHAAEVGAAALRQHPECCMAVGGHNLISPAGDLLRRCIKPAGLRDYYARLLRSNFIECISSVLFRRNMVSRISWFNPDLHAAEDYDLYLHLARQYPVCCHAGIVAEYRMHPGNASHQSEMMLRNTLRVIRSQAQYAGHTPFRFLSYGYGLWFWRRKYGRQLTRELVFASHMQDSTLELWKTLASTYLVGVPIVLLARSLPVRLAAAAFHIDYGPRTLDARPRLAAAGTASPNMPLLANEVNNAPSPRSYPSASSSEHDGLSENSSALVP
jgi:glycosyltransferase involved in cell wall biosynthesis